MDISDRCGKVLDLYLRFAHFFSPLFSCMRKRWTDTIPTTNLRHEGSHRQRHEGSRKQGFGSWPCRWPCVVPRERLGSSTLLHKPTFFPGKRLEGFVGATSRHSRHQRRWFIMRQDDEPRAKRVVEVNERIGAAVTPPWHTQFRAETLYALYSIERLLATQPVCALSTHSPCC